MRRNSSMPHSAMPGAQRPARPAGHPPGMSTVQSFDLVIIGGGPVGASLACAVAATPLRTALLERSSEFPQREDERALALSLASSYILRDCGAWDELGARPLRSIHVSAQGCLGTLRLRATDIDKPVLGYIVSAARLHAALWQQVRAAADSGLTLLQPAYASALQLQEDSVQLQVQQQGRTLQLRTRLLVAADGSDSPSCRQAGLPVRRRNYTQSALLTSCRPERLPPDTAYERFTAHGLLAVLPLNAERCKLVCMVPGEQAQELLQLPEPTFLGWAERQLGSRLGTLRQLGPRTSYPLYAHHATHSVQQRILPLGDAAHSIHPNAAQGLNLGLRDAALLAEMLAEPPADPGAAALLQNYQRLRQGDRLRTRALSEGLAALGTYSRLPPVAWTRSAGMAFIDLCPALKRRLLLSASGLWGRQPRIVREGAAGWAA